MAWKEYQRPHPTRKKHFYWQVHHENNKPMYTLADKLRIVSYRTNERERAATKTDTRMRDMMMRCTLKESRKLWQHSLNYGGWGDLGHGMRT